MQYYFPEFHLGAALWPAFVSVVIGYAAYCLVFHTRYFEHLKEKSIIPPFIVVPAFFLSLMLAFMSSAVWKNGEIASSALQSERSALHRLYSLPLQPDSLRLELARELDQYVRIIQEVEWGTNYNMKRSIDGDKALSQIRSVLWQAEKTNRNAEAGPDDYQLKSVLTELMTDIRQLESAREQRLSLGDQANLRYLKKWLIIYALALMASINICAINIEAPKAAVTAIIIFCICTALAFSMIQLHMHPYKGFDALTPDLVSVHDGLQKGDGGQNGN